MAKIEIQLEDLGDGDMRVSIKSDCDFPADTSEWTTAQQAAMAIHHNLGCALVDLATDEIDTSLGHAADCAELCGTGHCNCPKGRTQ